MVLASPSNQSPMQEQMNPSFDLKVALLGHVSVGKTTVLNALFKDRYGEVSMRRTTAGINHFLVNCASDSQTAEQVLREITTDNKVLRKDTTTTERFFDVRLDLPLLDMRNDTNLVIVDVPGLNEAGSREMYMDYVEDCWDTFDCVIVVMDACIGVNTEEQVNLLRFVKRNMKKQKQVPLIVLCNKVDDPDDAEVGGLVNEVKQKVGKMFPGILSRRNKKSMSAPDPSLNAAFIPISAEKAFLYRTASRLPLTDFKSIEKGCIDKIGYEECGKFKWKRLTRAEQYELVYGVVNDEAQYEERMKACNFDELLNTLDCFLGGAEIQEALIAKQLEVMMSKVSPEGGFADELCLIYNMNSALGRKVPGLRDMFWQLFNQANNDVFTEFEEDHMAVASLHSLMDELITYEKELHGELFREEGMDDDRKEDAAEIREAMKGLIKQFLGILIQEEAEWNFEIYFQNMYDIYGGMDNQEIVKGMATFPYGMPNIWEWQKGSKQWYNPNLQWTASGERTENPCLWRWKNNEWYHTETHVTREGTADVHPCMVGRDPDFSSWAKLSPYDWHSLLSSILLMKCNKGFCENFGSQITALEWLQKTGNFNVNESDCARGGPAFKKFFEEYETSRRGSYIRGEFVPDDENMYPHPLITAPDSPSDPEHWGHLIWKFCNYMDPLG